SAVFDPHASTIRITNIQAKFAAEKFLRACIVSRAAAVGLRTSLTILLCPPPGYRIRRRAASTASADAPRWPLECAPDFAARSMSYLTDKSDDFCPTANHRGRPSGRTHPAPGVSCLCCDGCHTGFAARRTKTFVGRCGAARYGRHTWRA